jgi:hypothetical protein
MTEGGPWARPLCPAGQVPARPDPAGDGSLKVASRVKEFRLAAERF